jgi:C4-dicarboxylate-specific signal transduction histidine kinase
VAQPLRRQVLLLNIAILVPVFVAAVWSSRVTYQEQLKQLEAEAFSLAGSIVVYLERGLDINDIRVVIGTIPLPPEAIITITDDQHFVLARNQDAQHYVGQIEPFPLASEDPPAFAIFQGADRVERVYSNQMFASGPWLISVGIPTAIAQRRIQPLVVRNLSIALGATWLTVLLEFLMLRPYQAAFDRAKGYASRVADGDLSPPKTTRMPTQELDTLQSTLVTMVNRLREAREKLAAQVGEERRIREELESLQRQVIRQERLAAIGVLASGVAHELNNPLQAILGSAELLQVREELPADARAELIMIQKESARASAIIRNLSRFSRQQPGDSTLVRLREVVDSVMQLRKRRLTEAGIQIAVQETSEPVAMAVFEELQQVVLNLVINAEQAVNETSAPRRIDIKLARIDDKVRLEVHDSGPGVPPENEPKLFQPFFTTKASGEGTGLGLSVSYGIVQSHGGTIGFLPGATGGAVFYFELPVAVTHLT